MNLKDIKAFSINMILPYMLIICQIIVFELSNEFGICNNLLFEVIVIYLIYILMLFILKSTRRTMFFLAILSNIILIIFQIKIYTIGEPIYFSDFKLLGNIGEILELVDFKSLFTNIDFWKFFLIMILVYAPIYYCSWRYPMKIIRRNKISITLTCISMILLIFIFFPNQSLDKLKLKAIYKVHSRELEENEKLYVSNVSYYINYGIIGGFYGTYLENIMFEPDGYNDEELERLLENAIVEKDCDLGKPNIIVIFSESFWDISLINEVQFDKEITTNFNRLKKEGLLINLISPSYGERSLNVDFELLTGGSMRYFSGGYIPLTQLYSDKLAYKYPSYINELKNNGYNSKIIFGKDYYKSKNSCYKLGFDDYIELEKTEENQKSGFISDEYITNYIIDEMERKEENQKVFLMAETIQNHQGYPIDKYTDYDIKLTNTSLDKEQSEIILSYAQGVFDADSQLGRLYDYIQSIDEPTILLFMGDHLPYLNTASGKNVFENLKYFNTDDKLLNLYRKYNTQALILSNYETNLKGKAKNFSCNLIFSYILNNMSIEISDFYKWLYTTSDVLPASNRYISLDKNNDLFYTNNLNNEAKNMYDIEEDMQYKFWKYDVYKK